MSYLDTITLAHARKYAMLYSLPPDDQLIVKNIAMEYPYDTLYVTSVFITCGHSEEETRKTLDYQLAIHGYR